MKLLVTGGAGFIGSNYIRYRSARHPEDEIVNFDLLTYAGDPTSLRDVEQAAPRRYKLHQGDVADRDAVRQAFETYRPDVIVNFAAESHNSRAVLSPESFLRTNTLGAQVLLDEALRLGVRRFHHVSTCEVYGDLPLDSDDRFREDSAYRPRTPYSASKAAADLIVRAYHETYGLPVTISNCCNNYGPYQYPEKVIPLFVTNALEDRPLPLYRSSAHRREWLHVDDHCRAIDLVIKDGRVGETYNVGSGVERSIEEIADAVLRILEKPASLKSYVPDRPGHDRRYLLDSSKIERELGWRPTIGFESGLRATIDWYRTTRGWWQPKRARALSDVDESSWDRARSR